MIDFDYFKTIFYLFLKLILPHMCRLPHQRLQLSLLPFVVILCLISEPTIGIPPLSFFYVVSFILLSYELTLYCYYLFFFDFIILKPVGLANNVVRNATPVAPRIIGVIFITSFFCLIPKQYFVITTIFYFFSFLSQKLFLMISIEMRQLLSFLLPPFCYSFT